MHPGRDCPRCARPLLPVLAAGARSAEVDVCAGCRLVWFDGLEFDTLDRLAWVDLLEALGEHPASAAEPALDLTGPAWRCPRCTQPLAASAGLTRYGRYGGLHCTQGHGQVLGVTALLASRGLLRPPSAAERVLLAREGRPLLCLSCGAPETAHDDACAHCGSPFLLLDLPLAAVALGQVDEGRAMRTRPGAAEGAPRAALRWPCHACGEVLDPTVQTQCPRCAHPVMAPLLADLAPLLADARSRLQAARDEAMRQSLTALPVSEHRRIAAITRRPEHRAAAERAAQSFWSRYGLVAAAFGLCLLVAFCNAR